jgi:hypothetical protein
MHPPLNWENLVINWGPMLLLIAVWVFFHTRMKSGGWQPPWQKEQAQRMDAATSALERIAKALEKRSF